MRHSIAGLLQQLEDERAAHARTREKLRMTEACLHAADGIIAELRGQPWPAGAPVEDRVEDTGDGLYRPVFYPAGRPG